MNLNFHESPHPPIELEILNHLVSRKSFSPHEKQNYKNLKKGYTGEQKFCNLLTENLPSNHLLLNSLRMSNNHSEFQMDSILICPNTIYLFEVKNFEGDFYIQRNNWHVYSTGKEINNPIIQLKRSESLLRQFIQNLGYDFQIKSYVVFINPEFVLFQAPLHLPIILPGQLNRFIKTLTSHSITPTKQQKKLAKSFVHQHFKRSPNERLPDYQYDQLKKGIKCKCCSGFLAYSSPSTLLCSHCNFENITEEAVMRSVEEYNLLFPNKQITTSKIYEWCAIIPSKKIIRRILSKYLVQKGKSKAAYYTFK